MWLTCWCGADIVIRKQTYSLDYPTILYNTVCTKSVEMHFLALLWWFGANWNDISDATLLGGKQLCKKNIETYNYWHILLQLWLKVIEVEDIKKS